ncbi:MAG: Mercuric transport protein MerT [Planctomycetota bacterium]|nr:MAG: Mercuric transport protein MerT [Planctomycetota bacterium]REJ92116.1 MAG: Mercuric transport protein MerT [Planctomycetota bacterium]REK28652.1 MAG: Mercuric transport protein MerT [Planctomycetota bacterium]REK39266.1 MAG: Mercuric transport protein MerT [Planctomycetota bacterium]
MFQAMKMEKQLVCPSCGNKGRAVGVVTLRTLLNDEHASQFDSEADSCRQHDGAMATGCTPNRHDTGWRFCDSSNCDVVYFAEQSDATFAKSDLRVQVGVKETTGERPLCYCFGHSVTSVKQELRGKGHSDALEDIRAKMKSPGCRCETENPSGSCCLGSVAKGVKIAQEELGMTDMSPQANVSASQSSGSRGELIAKLGAVGSAIVASACCWLPLVLLAVGVSGAGVAATLESYRPIFVTATIGFLGAAFYFTYRPRRTADSKQGCCPTESTASKDCCANSGKRRFNMMTVNKAMLWVVTVLAIAFLFFPSYVGALLGTSGGEQITDNMNTAVFKIDGMTCEGCASTAEKAIRDVPDVVAVEVDYENGRAVVGTEVCCPVPHDAIIKALQQAGYEARVSESDESLQDLSTDAREFKQAFNAAKGRVRLVMLVSPG